MAFWIMVPFLYKGEQSYDAVEVMVIAQYGLLI